MERQEKNLVKESMRWIKMEWIETL